MAKRSTQPASAAIDQQLAMAALDKQRRGESPTREERDALRRYEEAHDETLRIKHYSSIRKKEWVEWSGRQVKVINEQAERYGAPIGGATIDIRNVAKWLHDFLAQNSRRLSNPDNDDPDYAGCSSPALEQFREVRTKREELAYERDLKIWIRRDDVRKGFIIIADRMKKANEALLKQFGAKAQKILNDAWEDVTREIDNHFGDDDGGCAPQQ
jgi:hypothetical protein